MPASSNYRLTLGLSIALALLTLLVYCRSFDFGFIQFDDPQYVAENPHVLAGVTSDGLRWAFTTFDWSNWHPLTWLSLQVDASFYGGPKAGRFHATNVLLHIANAVLLSLVLGRMTGMVWRSAMVAALFALHPLHVESVAWVSERKDVLSTLFWMLTMTAYVAYVRRPSVKRYVLIVLALTLGLMAKPMLITLPFVLLLLDFWPLGRLQGGPEPVVADSRPRALSLSRLWGEKLPLLIVVLGSCVVTFLAQFRGRAVGTLESYPLHVRFLNALLAYGTYLAQLFLPRNLAVFYPHPGSQVSLVQAMAAGALLLAISWLVLGPGRRFPYLAVGWLWYLGTLVPVIGLVQVGHQAMADRYTYVPMIGCFLMLAWGVTDLTLARGWPRLSSIALATVVLSACCALTWVQLGYWHDDFSMWEHTVKVTKRNAPAHSRLGEAFLKGSRPEEAEAEFRQAIAIDPNFSEAHWGLGNLLMQSDRLEEAQAEYRTALDLEPDTARLHHNLGNVLFNCGYLKEADAEFSQALALDSSQPLAHFGRGSLLRMVGRKNEALEEFRRAVALDPNFFHAQNAMSETLLELGLFNEAEASTRRALEMLPANHPLRSELLNRQKSVAQLRSLEDKLPSILAGKADLVNVNEQFGRAWLCQLPRLRHYTVAARLYTLAFAAMPIPATDPRNAYFHLAACAAAKAGTGADEGNASLGEAERSRLREQALDWLRHELAFCIKRAQSSSTTEQRTARRTLHQWQLELDLSCVRDPAALAKLPETERSAWQEFWQEVERTLVTPPLGSLSIASHR